MHFLHNNSQPREKKTCAQQTDRFLRGIFLFSVFFLPHARTDYLTRNKYAKSGALQRVLVVIKVVLIVVLVTLAIIELVWYDFAVGVVVVLVVVIVVAIVVIVVVELVWVRLPKNNVKAVVVEVIGVVVEREVVIIVGIKVPVDLVNGLVLCRTLNSRACLNK